MKAPEWEPDTEFTILVMDRRNGGLWGIDVDPGEHTLRLTREGDADD